MTLRLLRILVDAGLRERAEEILEEHAAAPRWCMPMQDGRVMVEVLLPATGNEPILDALEEAFRHTEGFRLIFFPVQATVPRLPEKGDGDAGDEGSEEAAGGEHEAGPAAGGGPEASAPGQERAPATGGVATASHAEGTPGPIRSGPPTQGAAAGTDSPPSTRPPAAPSEAEEEAAEEERRVPLRVNREELYASLSDASRTTSYYLGMVALSSVVACAGLLLGDGAVIIGAMVIAPLIGPSIAVAFATTLGDLGLGRRAIGASLSGMLVAFAVAFLAGTVLEVDPAGAEIARRTHLTFEHLALALAAGAAGAIATSKGVGTGLVGVMVAVALLPPLANGGLLLGGGHVGLGIGALILVFGNVVCVSLTATATFLVQGVRPNTWWEVEARRPAVTTAVLLWGLLVLALFGVVWLGWGGPLPG